MSELVAAAVVSTMLRVSKVISMKSHFFAATFLIVGGCSALAACSDNSKESEMQNRVAQLEKENSNLRSQLETAHKAIDFQYAANSAQQAADSADEAE